MDDKRRAHILETTLNQNYPRSPPSVSALKENTWIKLPKFSDGYISGVKDFIKNAVSRFSVGDEILGRSCHRARHDLKCLKTSTQASTPAPIDSYVQELTKKIRQEVSVEVEAKLNQKVCAEVDGKINQKVQDNLTLVLKKLVEANPILNVDIGEICATISSDTVGDGTCWSKLSIL
ncbi:hypothetical protein OROHE_007620 [Orobanche hederae]